METPVGTPVEPPVETPVETPVEPPVPAVEDRWGCVVLIYMQCLDASTTAATSIFPIVDESLWPHGGLHRGFTGGSTRVSTRNS